MTFDFYLNLKVIRREGNTASFSVAIIQFEENITTRRLHTLA
jgi:hypothetical protein